MPAATAAPVQFPLPSQWSDVVHWFPSLQMVLEGVLMIAQVEVPLQDHTWQGVGLWQVMEVPTQAPAPSQ